MACFGQAAQIKAKPGGEYLSRASLILPARNGLPVLLKMLFGN